MNRAVSSVPERFNYIRKQNECKLFFAELWAADQWQSRETAHDRRPVAHKPVEGEHRRPGGPQPRYPPCSPRQGREHRGRERGERVEPGGFRPPPLRQREQPARQAAQGTIEAREPVKRAQPPTRLIRRRIPVERGEHGGRREPLQSDAMVCGSNPTISRYAMVMAANVIGIVTKSPTRQHSTPSRFTSAAASRNIVKPK
jgi:hypothetical protein